MEFADIFHLFENLLSVPDRQFVAYLQQVNLLRSTLRCKVRTCRRECNLIVNARKPLGHVFYCKRCKKQYSILLNSFFETIKVPPRKVIYVMWCWSCEMRVGCTVMNTGVSKYSVIQIYRWIRDICSWKLLEEDGLFKLGMYSIF